jgi:hypothetical protein
MDISTYRRSVAVFVCLALGVWFPNDGANQAAGGPPAATSPPVALPTGLLQSVHDRTEGILDDEREPYYQVLDRARRVRPAELAAAGRQTLERFQTDFEGNPKNARRKFSLFADMVQHPDAFRGQPVRLHGYIRRVESFDAGENDQGLKTLHQVWLFTDDSQRNPWVVVCSELPEGMPIPRPASPTNDIYVSGYFFKLWSFRAERGQWGAPLILAGQLEWRPPPPLPSTTPLFRMLLGGSLVIVVLAIVVGIVFRARSDRAFRAAREAQQTSGEADTLRTLRDFEH